MDIDHLKYDTGAYEEGLWVKDIPDFGDIELLVRGQLSDHSLAARARILRSLPDDARDADGQLTELASIQVYNQVIAESVLAGWRNITSSGEVLEFDRNNISALLANKRFRMNAVAYAMEKVDGLVRAKKDDAIKN